MAAKGLFMEGAALLLLLLGMLVEDEVVVVVAAGLPQGFGMADPVAPALALELVGVAPLLLLLLELLLPPIMDSSKGC